MDDFRKLQKLQVGDAVSGGWGRKYGCDCCNGNTGSLKVRKCYQRKRAKARFREQTRKLLQSPE